jgi:hypothetical protein
MGAILSQTLSTFHSAPTNKPAFDRASKRKRETQAPQNPQPPHALGSGDRAVIAIGAFEFRGRESGCSEFSKFTDESMTTRSTGLSNSSRVLGARCRSDLI